MIRRLLDRLRPRPQRPRLPLDLPIAETRIVSLDCETTGLDPRRDRIVSLATVPIEGERCLDVGGIDRLINPGRPIPERSSAVHGIDDRDVVDAPPFAAVFPELQTALAGAVMLGHEIGFDAAMIRHETHLARLPWVTPPMIDTLLLYSAIEPDASDLRLEALADRLGIVINGRHTALGDARATAEIYLRLLPALNARGIATLGDIIELCHDRHRALRLRMGPRW